MQLDLVRSGRPGPVTGGAASRNPGPATPAQCVAAQIAYGQKIESVEKTVSYPFPA